MGLWPASRKGLRARPLSLPRIPPGENTLLLAPIGACGGSRAGTRPGRRRDPTRAEFALDLPRQTLGRGARGRDTRRVTELITLFVIITLSLMVVRVGMIALQKTGLSRDAALFQSQSAFMGVGFTTSESETVVAHPVRRRIIRGLMLLGFGAILSVLGTTVLTFAILGEEELKSAWKAVILISGVLVIWIGAHLRVVDRFLDRVITYALEHTTALKIIDFEDLLDLDKGYSVSTLPVHDGSWLEGRTLRQLALADEGVLVLNIAREGGVVICTPASRTKLQTGNRILAYGLEESLMRLRDRPGGAEGDRDHEDAVRVQRLRIVEECAEDELAQREAEAAPRPEPQTLPPQD